MASRYNWRELYSGLQAGNRVKLGRALSLIESQKAEDRAESAELIDACLRAEKRETIRVGITGSPGSGKSSTIECLGTEAISRGHRVAVLTVDPSSSITGGSILGDKTRMPRLASSDKAFIRPSAAGNTLGGVASTTREAIILCEAAGYDFIVVETVGVGQSETAVYHMTDLFVFLILPGAGDELQGIKRGIVEMADLVIINKADEDRINLADQAQKDYRNALHLFREKESGWQSRVMKHSIFDPSKTSEVLDQIQDFNRFVSANGYKFSRRTTQQLDWFEEMLRRSLLELVVSTRRDMDEQLSTL
nr:methylmalonyl Co-A mutase-associated GTPase MeaB [Saprospiraceae bacterium]